MNNEYKLDKLHTFTKILIVENVFYVKKSLSKILNEAGYFVLTSSSGQEALDKFRKYTPDIVITGRKLPDMRGYDLIKNLRDEKNRYKTKILYISKSDEVEETSSQLLEVIDGLVSAPIKKDDLLTTVKKLLYPGQN